MAVPDSFLAELRQRRLQHRVWLEIEGIPDALGNFAADASLWSPLPDARERFASVLDLAAEVPSFSSHALDHTAGRVSMGTCGFVATERDGFLHRLFATRRPGVSLRLATALGREFTTAFVFAPEDEWAALPETGVAYLGRETIAFTKNDHNPAVGVGTLTVERGLYRSRIIGHAQGEALTLHPTVLADRRAWLWWSLGGPITASALQYVGHIESVEWRDGGTALAFALVDEQGDAKTPLFTEAFDWFRPNANPTKLEVFRDNYGRSNPVEGWCNLDASLGWVRPIHDGEARPLIVSSADIRESRLNDTRPIRIDAAAMRTNVIIVEGRGVDEFGAVYGHVAAAKTITQADPIDLIKAFYAVLPAFLITRYEPDHPWRKHVIWRRGNHPLQIELQLLLSKNGDGSNGWYDVLPPGYGYGIDERRVDVAQYESLIRATSDLRVETVITSPPEDGREWRIKNLYQPFGFYPRLVFGGRYSAGWIGPPTPEAVARAVTLTEDRIIEWSGPRTKKRDVVGAFTFKADARIGLQPPHDLETRPAYRVAGVAAEEVRFADDLSDVRAGDMGTGRTVEVDTTCLSNWSSEQGSIVPSDPIPHAHQVAARLAGYIRQRFRSPHSYTKLTLRLEDAPISVGDLVYVDARSIPNTRSETAGMAKALCEVVEKQIDFRATTVTLTVAQSDITDESRIVRYLSPAMRCVSVESAGVATDRITVEANRYTAAPDVDSDAFVYLSDGHEHGGDRCVIARPDRSLHSAPFEVLAREGDTHIIVAKSALAAWSFQPGDVILYAPRADVTPRQRALYSYRAKATRRFSDGTDAQRWP